MITVLGCNIPIQAQTQSSREWKNYASNAAAQYFYDPARIKGDLNDLKIQVKANFKGDIKDGIQSRLYEYALSCQDKTYVIETIRTYTEPDLAGVEQVRNNTSGLEKRPAPANSLSGVTLDVACKAKSAPAPLNTAAPAVVFKHVNKLSPFEINEILLKKTWSNDHYNGFLHNYSFIHSLHRKTQLTDENFLRWNTTHKEAFRPFNAQIINSLAAMNGVIANIAKTIQVPPSVIHQAFGLELEKAGYLKESDNKSISTARLLADDYWMRFPDKQRSVNDWYDAKDPAELFGKFYPTFASAYNRDMAALSKLATDYENRKVDEAKKREEHEMWLQTAEGKKHLADEEAKRRREAEATQRAEAAEAARIAKEFPFYAEVTCNNGGYGNFPIHACFTGTKDVLFEVHNGSDYHFYALPDIFNLSARPGRNSEAFINLRNKFQIKMQNAGDQWILGLRVIKRQTGEVIFQKKVSGFGVISVKN